MVKTSKPVYGCGHADRNLSSVLSRWQLGLLRGTVPNQREHCYLLRTAVLGHYKMPGIEEPLFYVATRMIHADDAREVAELILWPNGEMDH